MRKTILKNIQMNVRKAIAGVLAAATVFSVLPTTANAAEAKKVSDIFVSECDYENTLNNKVEPYINAYKKTGYITGNENAKLYYEKYVKENAKGTIVISHGLGESLEKYDEMIYYFLNMGYSVYGMEHRGHSRSGRLGADSSQVYIESFSYYFKDLKIFLDQIVVPEATKKNLYLFGHSMGGGIATRFLETYPEYFQAAILSAPMLEINSGKVPPIFAKMLAHTVALTPYKYQYVFGETPYSETYDFAGCHTHSEARYRRNFELKKNDPALQMGGCSFQWLSESYYAALMATSKCEASKVKVPVLLFQAGQDTLVGANGQNTFEKYAANVTKVRYENAKHEMYFETDDILYDYLGKVFDFLGRN